MATVVFTAGSGKRAFELTPNGGVTVVIGRSEQADLYVNSPRLSRRHCQVIYGARGLELHDLGSSNGTFLNGRKIEKVLLRSGDVIQVGGIAISLEFELEQVAREKSGEDMKCEKCGRLISMATVDDGQVFELGEHFVCPACAEGERLADFSEAERRTIERLASEGYQVEGKTPLSRPIVPVFKARRLGLDTLVTIKALPVVSGVSKKKVERFQIEAKAAAKVKHPNVIQVFDIRRMPDLLYIVMEHVEGETLLERIERKGPLPQRDVLRIGLQVTKALEAAEKQGIVHRDLKPANIMISSVDGAAKICDFGLAKDLWSLTGGLTGPEETLGTIRYMPPEQVRNASTADHRADIFALAATLYHAFTGKPPFHDRKELDLMRHVVAGTLPPFDPKAPEIPAPVQAALAKAMRPSPDERWKGATEFKQALGAAVGVMMGIPGFKGDPELLLEIRDPRALDSTWSGRVPVAPKPGGMAGAFEGDQLVEFVQMLGMTSKTGVLQVTSEISGHLAFRDGKVVACVTSRGTRGREGAYEMLASRRGSFEFRPELPPTVKSEVMLAVEGLLLEALRRRDEAGAPPGAKS